MMRPNSLLLLSALLAAPFSNWAAAAPAVVPAAVPTAAPVVPAPPSVAAKSWLVMDYRSGRMLAEQNADERIEPASLTKIMTAYVVAGELKAGRIKMDDMVTISERAWRRGYKTDGSKMFIEVGKQVSVADLLKGVVIASGNDACVALAEHIAGTEEAFVDLMNGYAKKLGMTGTHFANSDGLPDPNHYSTARDLAVLSAALIRDYPDEYALHAVKEFTFNGITQRNRNDLLFEDPEVDGVKTGHHEAAGYCLIASAVHDGMRLISVVIGTDSTKARASASQALLSYAFRFYETRRLYAGREKIAASKVWKGAADSVDLGIADDLYVTIPRGSADRIEKVTDIEPTIVAPVGAGAVQGRLRVRIDGAEIANRPLIALGAIEQGGLLTRLSDGLRLFFQ